MLRILAGALSVALVFGMAGAADAKTKKKRVHNNTYSYNSPSAIAERQRHASTFDSTEYFEQDSRKIPFGTAEWWRQKERESGDRW